MIWLLTEILVFVLAAAVFGGLVGLGLASARSGASRPSKSFEEEHQGLLDRLADFERAQRATEAKAAARAAAEAAVRGELEGRLVETEAAAADLRARAEAAERNVRASGAPAEAGPLIEAVVLSSPGNETAELASLRDAADAAEAARGKTELDLRQVESERDAARDAAAAAEQALEAERARLAQELAGERQMRVQEVGSLEAQLAAAERMRAKSEGDLAQAHARAHEVMRVAAALMGQAAVPAANAPAGAAAMPFSAPAPTDAQQSASGSVGDKPPSLSAPRGGSADDLRRIKGVGIKNEGVLNALGIYHYQQIAAFTPANVEWLDAHLKSQGRIAREDWVGQAKALMAARDNSGKVHPDDAGV